MENDALLESTEAGGNGEGNGEWRPVFGFTGLGDSKTKAKAGEDFVNTYKNFLRILRSKWGDFGEKGVLVQVRGLNQWDLSFYCLHKELGSLWKFKLHVTAFLYRLQKRLLILMDHLLGCQAFYRSYLIYSL